MDGMPEYLENKQKRYLQALYENILYKDIIVRHKEKQECHFVVCDGYDISEVIQVCVSLTDEKTKKREINGLIEAIAVYQLKTGLIITEDELFDEMLESNGQSYQITAKPCWKWLLES